MSSAVLHCRLLTYSRISHNHVIFRAVSTGFHSHLPLSLRLAVVALSCRQSRKSPIHPMVETLQQLHNLFCHNPYLTLIKQHRLS